MPTSNPFPKFLITFSCVLALSGCAQLQNLGQGAWSGTQKFSKGAYQTVAGLLRPAPPQRAVFSASADAHAQTQTAQPDIQPDMQPDIPGFIAHYSPQHEMDGVEMSSEPAAKQWDTERPVQTAPRQMAMRRTREAGVMVYRPGRGVSETSAPLNTVPLQRIAPAKLAPALIPPPNLRPASSPYGSTAAPRVPGTILSGLAGAPRPSAPQRPSEGTDLVDTSFVKIGGGSDMADWQACEQSADGVFVPANTDAGYSVSARFLSCMRAKGYVPESEALVQMQKEAAL